MEETGPHLGMPYTRPMGRGLSEIRVKGPDGLGRVFYCARPGRRIIMLHGYIKKSQKTPARELEVAHRRLKEVTGEVP